MCNSQVHREFIQVTGYRIFDEDCNLGEQNVEIIYSDDVGSTESFELATLSYSNKGIDLRSSSGCCNEFDKITRELRGRVSKVECELHERNVQTQKELHEFALECQTIGENVSFRQMFDVNSTYSI